MRRLASSIEAGSFTFRSSSRNLPLKDSMKVCSVGLPGRMKSGVTPLFQAHSSSDFEVNPVFHDDRLGQRKGAGTAAIRHPVL